MGYTGLLGGPPAIGLLAEHAGLPVALARSPLLAVVAAVLVLTVSGERVRLPRPRVLLDRAVATVGARLQPVVSGFGHGTGVYVRDLQVLMPQHRRCADPDAGPRAPVLAGREPGPSGSSASGQPPPPLRSVEAADGVAGIRPACVGRSSSPTCRSTDTALVSPWWWCDSSISCAASSRTLGIALRGSEPADQRPQHDQRDDAVDDDRQRRDEAADARRC